MFQWFGALRCMSRMDKRTKCEKGLGEYRKEKRIQFHPEKDDKRVIAFL